VSGCGAVSRRMKMEREDWCRSISRIENPLKLVRERNERKQTDKIKSKVKSPTRKTDVWGTP